MRAIVNTRARSCATWTTSTTDRVRPARLPHLLSHASSVRLDSFVYTVEGLREAARAAGARRGPWALLAVFNDEVGRKIFLMLEEAFDGRPAGGVRAGYDGAVVFLAAAAAGRWCRRACGRIRVPDVTAFYGRSPRLLATPPATTGRSSTAAARLSVSYVLMAARSADVLLLSESLNRTRPHVGISPLPPGRGFMLIEAKGITELGLTFGNSWQVIGS